MGFFTDLKNCIFSKDKKLVSETETAIKKLSDWKSSRLSYNCYTYYPESGKRIDLKRMPVPGEGFKFWLGGKNSTIGDKAQKICELLVKEIDDYRSYVKKLDSLNDELKNDSFFTEVDHIFANKLKKLHNELLFCKFEKLNDSYYYKKFGDIINSICADLKTINTYFSDYMYALSKLGYEDNRSDLERIKISVKAMSEAVDTVRSDM